MADIFISYAGEDQQKAELLVHALVARGRSVWWDRVIPAGRRFDEVIDEAINDARCMVVLWSTTSVGKDWVLEEAAEGKARDILVPVTIEKVRLPRGFRRIQAADLVGWDGVATHSAFQALAVDVSAVLRAAPGKRRTLSEVLTFDEFGKYARLVFLTGSQAGTSYQLARPTHKIGRAPDCDFRFSLDEVLTSAEHALIEGKNYAGGFAEYFILRDLNSRNGTFVNERPVREVLLRTGDVIEFAAGGPRAQFIAQVESAVLELTPDIRDLTSEALRRTSARETTNPAAQGFATTRGLAVLLRSSQRTKVIRRLILLLVVLVGVIVSFWLV